MKKNLALLIPVLLFGIGSVRVVSLTPTDFLLDGVSRLDGSRMVRGGEEVAEPDRLYLYDWFLAKDRTPVLIDGPQRPPIAVIEKDTEILVVGSERIMLLAGELQTLETEYSESLVILVGESSIYGSANAGIRTIGAGLEIAVESGRLVLRRGEQVVRVLDPGERYTESTEEAYTEAAHRFTTVYGEAVDSFLSTGEVPEAARESLLTALVSFLPLFAQAEIFDRSWERSPDLVETYLTEALYLLSR